jgi:ketosteroid isomerase-like protein
MTNVQDIATTYFASWKAKDFDRLRSVLADDVSFVGPLAQLEGAAACREGIERLGEITTDIVVEKVFVDGPDVLTWFELHTEVAPPASVANWSHVEDGKITRIRVTFDPRPLVSPDPSAG